MKNRRDFIKTTFAAAAGAVAVSAPSAFAGAATPLPKGLIYTKENPGKWAKKVGSHLPVVSVEGNKITITTDHGMSEKHYIVRHTLVTGDGEVLGEKTFHYSDEEATSVFEVEGKHPVLYATSFCNKHDMWVAELSL